MRTRRLLNDQGLSYYHCLSRVIERRFIFGEQEREQFRKLMRRQEAFSGVRVLTWTCLSNHFHVLVAVEDKKGRTVQAEMQRLLDDDAAFLARLKFLYEPDALEEIEKLLKAVRSTPAPTPPSSSEGEDAGGNAEADKGGGNGKKRHRDWKAKAIRQIKQPFLDRMYDLSCFVGELKQRISQWYNLRNERKGPLWEDRFKSVLVQGTTGVLATVAAYIDLNAVRAGIVKEPKDWRWCGYAEAAAAQSSARGGNLRGAGRVGRRKSGRRRLAASAPTVSIDSDMRGCPTPRRGGAGCAQGTDARRSGNGGGTRFRTSEVRASLASSALLHRRSGVGQRPSLWRAFSSGRGAPWG